VARTMTKIPQALIFKVGKWVEARRELISQGKYTLETLAVDIGKEFEIKCSVWNVRSLLEGLEIEIPVPPNRVETIYGKIIARLGSGEKTLTDHGTALAALAEDVVKLKQEIVTLRNFIHDLQRKVR